MIQDDQLTVPLPLRAQPFPWEDIYSLISRIARHMGYEQTSWLLRPESSQHQIRAATLPVLSDRADYAFLEHLLLLDEETLYALTLNRFAATLTPPSLLPGFEDIYSVFMRSLQAPPTSEKYSSSRVDRPLLTELDYRTFFLPSSSIKVCPSCLGEQEAYDRLYWRTRFLITCPQHAVVLRSMCPACHAAIPSLRSAPTICPACGKGNYRTSPFSLQPYLPAASFLLAGDLLTFKALGIKGTSVDKYLPGSQLEELELLTSQQYFALLRSFCRVVKILSADYLLAFLTPEFHALLTQFQGTSQVLPLRDTRVQIAITYWLFASWPNHFFAFLDVLQLWSFQWHFGQSFEHYLPQLFIGGGRGEAFAFLDHVYARYQSTHIHLYDSELIARIQQRLYVFGDIPYDSLRG